MTALPRRLEGPRALAVRPALRGRAGVLPALVGALVASALAELLLMRTFYRVGIFLPRDGGFRRAYAVLTGLGSFAFNLASVLVLVALALVLVAAMRRGRSWPALAVGGFLAASLLAVASGGAALRPVVRAAFVASVLAAAWPVVRSGGPAAVRALVAGVAAAVVASSYAGGAADAQALLPGAAPAAGAAAAQLVGEALVVATAFGALAARAAEGRVPPGALLAGTLSAAAFLGAWWADGSVAGILVLWTSGLRLFLPVWGYALALGAAVAAAVAWVRPAPWRSAGLALLLAGGFLLDTTYQQSLVLLGLLLLSTGAALGGLPGWEDRSEEADADAER